jgi:hypothetical protein
MCLSIEIARPGDVLAKGEHVGFEWIVTHNGMGHRCGYVRVPKGHPWHGKDYDDLEVNIHGGLSFAENDVPYDKGVADDAYWLGFDCAHSGDAPDPKLGGKLSEFAHLFPFNLMSVRTQEYVENECKSLCEQAATAKTEKPKTD